MVGTLTFRRLLKVALGFQILLLPQGKPSETVGHKAKGTKSRKAHVSQTAKGTTESPEEFGDAYGRYSTYIHGLVSFPLAYELSRSIPHRHFIYQPLYLPTPHLRCVSFRQLRFRSLPPYFTSFKSAKFFRISSCFKVIFVEILFSRGAKRFANEFPMGFIK